MKQIIATMVFLSMLAGMNACDKSKDSKDVAEEKNEEKFENKGDERDAQFVVETTSQVHRLIALADVAIEKNSKKAASTAQDVKPEYQSILTQVEEYAEAHVISVPSEATEKETNDARKLLDEKQSKFDSEWCSEIRKDNQDLIGKMESYGEKTKDLNLKTWLNSALPQVRAIQDKLVDMENKVTSN